MDELEREYFRNSDIPWECCPTCERTDWEWTARTGIGITRVDCRFCGRRYVRVTLREAIRMLSASLTPPDVGTNLGSTIRTIRELGALCRQVPHLYGLKEPVTVCTREGEVSDDDETPF